MYSIHSFCFTDLFFFHHPFPLEYQKVNLRRSGYPILWDWNEVCFRVRRPSVTLDMRQIAAKKWCIRNWNFKNEGEKRHNKGSIENTSRLCSKYSVNKYLHCNGLDSQLRLDNREAQVNDLYLKTNYWSGILKVQLHENFSGMVMG